MHKLLLPVALLAVSTPALAAPVEVTRFHTAESVASLGRGAVAVVSPQGEDASSLENRVWLEAVQRELMVQGFGGATPGAADRIAEVRVERRTERSEGRRGPVSVGVGGSTGGWSSGVGLGVGFNLGGGPKERTWTRLSVTIRDRATGTSLWEARAENVEKAKSRQASADQAAPRMAKALFAGFPGTSGATITVK